MGRYPIPRPVLNRMYGIVHVTVIVGAAIPLAAAAPPLELRLEPALMGLPLLDTDRRVLLEWGGQLVHLVCEVAFPQVGIQVDDHGRLLSCYALRFRHTFQ